jgi:hypothetical protein
MLPRCVGGENACPPEDCGSFPGFEEIKDVLAKGRGPQYRAVVNWLDTYYPDYDPREFSKGSVNKILKIGALALVQGTLLCQRKIWINTEHLKLHPFFGPPRSGPRHFVVSAEALA